MNKIDLITSAIEDSLKDYSTDQYGLDYRVCCRADIDVAHTDDCKLAQALVYARELRELKPVVYQIRMKADWLENWQAWKDCSEGVANDYVNTPRLNDWSFEVRKLYALDEVTK
jgi:hypothetical protein